MSWNFARRPKWIVRHVAVALLVVTMVLLGLWQLRRLDEKRDIKATVEAQQAEPATAVEEVVSEDLTLEDDLDAIQHRPVIATGCGSGCTRTL